MDVNYVTAYQEVLLENLDAILKQNFQFQTRLKLYEMDSNKQAELQAKFNELSANYQEVVNKLDEFKNSSQVYRVQAESSDAIVQEKNRIQSALNDAMREITVLNQSIQTKDREISDLKDIIAKPKEEEKPKKVAVKKVEDKPEETKIENLAKPKIDSVNTF
jgi:predicted RNase H-like nuclease (RuvC/YqgF family)